MDLLSTVLTAVVTSGAITGLVAAGLRVWLEGRIKLEHDKLLASFKAEQDRVSTETNELLKIRLQVFPELTELIYRIRNAARDIRDNPPQDASALEPLSEMIRSFESKTFAFRLPLEQAGVFVAVHAYKRHLQTFLLGARELAAGLRENAAAAEMSQLRSDLANIWADIDRLHQDIVAELVVLAFSRTTTPPAESRATG
jgi:hypothetical protein